MNTINIGRNLGVVGALQHAVLLLLVARREGLALVRGLAMAGAASFSPAQREQARRRRRCRRRCADCSSSAAQLLVGSSHLFQTLADRSPCHDVAWPSLALKEHTTRQPLMRLRSELKH